MALTKPKLQIVHEPTVIPFTQKLVRKLYRKTSPDPHLFIEGAALCALANWHLLEPHFLAQRAYAAEEGLNVTDLWHRMIENNTRRSKR